MMRLFSFCVAFLAFVPKIGAYDVLSLNSRTFDEQTSGKTVFIKFFAPWCAFCKRLAPDWEKLAEEWDGNEVGLVAEVDCSSKLGKIFCEYMDIKSFPTLMYGHPNSMEEYEGGRTYQELSEFAKENLVPQCTPTDLDRCDAVTRELIEQYLAKSKQELMAMVKVEEAKLKEAKEKYDAELDALQAKYEEAAKVRDEAIEAVRKGGIHLMKAVVKTKVTPPTITAKKVTTEEL